MSGTYPDGTSSTTFSYDAADNAAPGPPRARPAPVAPRRCTQSFSGTGGSINPDGQLTQYSTSYAGSCSGRACYQRDYSYDPAGRVVYQGSPPKARTPTTSPTTLPGTRPKFPATTAAGNFDTYSQVFDGDGEVTAQTPVSGSDGTTSTYAYDTLGDQAQFALTGTATTVYGYDQVGQLASATTPAALATYLYNGDGLEASDQVYSPLWGPPTTVDSTRSVHGVSCPTTSFCAAVDTSGYATVYNGSSWSSPSDIDGSHALEAVSCTSSSFCKAVDNDGEVASYNGTSWSVTSAVDSTRTINAVSCPTASFCAAVDNSGYITTYNGTSWATAADKDGSHALEAVSCTSSSFCVATDNDGNVLTYNGTSWSSATSEDSTRTVHGVSCPTTSFCAAVDTSGLRYDLQRHQLVDTLRHRRFARSRSGVVHQLVVLQGHRQRRQRAHLQRHLVVRRPGHRQHPDAERHILLLAEFLCGCRCFGICHGLRRPGRWRAHHGRLHPLGARRVLPDDELLRCRGHLRLCHGLQRLFVVEPV